MKFNKLKSIFLSSALAISIFFTGCSNGDQNTITNQTQIKDSTSSNSQVSVESNSSYQSASKEVPKGSVKATIERVVDGDTMKLKLDKTKEVVTLRLLLVDTPESVKKGVDPQPYSIEASNFAKNTLKAGDTVYIEYDEGDKTDKYDRHLGYLWYYSKDDSNWQMFNETLISQGYARVGYIYSKYYVSGFLFCLLMILPTTAAFVAVTMYAAMEAFKTSISFCGTFINSINLNINASTIKSYNYRFLAYTVIIAIISALDAILSYSFSSLFNLF